MIWLEFMDVGLGAEKAVQLEHVTHMAEQDGATHLVTTDGREHMAPCRKDAIWRAIGKAMEAMRIGETPPIIIIRL
jgi:hypothetical protein